MDEVTRKLFELTQETAEKQKVHSMSYARRLLDASKPPLRAPLQRIDELQKSLVDAAALQQKAAVVAPAAKEKEPDRPSQSGRPAAEHIDLDFERRA